MSALGEALACSVAGLVCQGALCWCGACPDVQSKQTSLGVHPPSPVRHASAVTSSQPPLPARPASNKRRQLTADAVDSVPRFFAFLPSVSPQAIRRSKRPLVTEAESNTIPLVPVVPNREPSKRENKLD